MTELTTPVHLCLHCGSISAHPMDVQERYCGRCHHWCDDQPGPARPHGGVGDWCVPGTRVIVDNVRTPFHGDHGRVVRRVAPAPGDPPGLVLVQLDDEALVGKVEFGTGELRPEPETTP